MKLNYIIEKNDENKELKQILKKKLYISNILLLKLKNTKSIFVNGIPTFVTYKVKENDSILVDFDNMYSIINKEQEKFSDKYITLKNQLEILYEDEYLLIVNKPPYLPVHPSSSHYENTLSNYVAYYLETQGIYQIHIVTRLDKDTSGVCIFAKNEYIQELFVRKKEIINFKKEYLAVVNGIVQKDHDILELPIARSSNSIITREVNSDGDFAKTEYTVINRNHSKNYTILNIKLHTGRTHQIRVHMSHIGHILLGDELYAIKHKYEGNIREYIKRQALHAYKITFNHPITNKIVCVEAPIPEDIKNLI